MKIKAYIFDIDWTLAKMNWRSPYDYSKVIEDRKNKPVIQMLSIISEKYKIILCSWRPDSCKKETEDWLKINWIEYNELHMRKTWDIRNDSVIKQEIYNNEIFPIYEILWVFDDRDRVVKMWRDLWLCCFQVDYGNF